METSIVAVAEQTTAGLSLELAAEHRPVTVVAPTRLDFHQFQLLKTAALSFRILDHLEVHFPSRKQPSLANPGLGTATVEPERSLSSVGYNTESETVVNSALASDLKVDIGSRTITIAGIGPGCSSASDTDFEFGTDFPLGYPSGGSFDPEVDLGKDSRNYLKFLSLVA